MSSSSSQYLLISFPFRVAPTRRGLRASPTAGPPLLISVRLFSSSFYVIFAPASQRAMERERGGRIKQPGGGRGIREKCTARGCKEEGTGERCRSRSLASAAPAGIKDYREPSRGIAFGKQQALAHRSFCARQKRGGGGRVDPILLECFRTWDTYFSKLDVCMARPRRRKCLSLERFFLAPGEGGKCCRRDGISAEFW